MRVLLVLLLTALTLRAEPPLKPRAFDAPGQIDDTTVRLPNQWLLKPVGFQIRVGDFPSNIAVHPSGAFAAVLHCGYGTHEIVIVDIAAREIHSRVRVNESFHGIAFSRDGSRLFCSGSGDEVVHAFRFDRGFLGDHATFVLRDVKKRGIPAGIAVSGDGRILYVANVWGHTVSRVALGAGEPRISELALQVRAPAEAPPRAATTDDPSITKRAEALLDATGSDDPFPYGLALDEKRRRLYVSLWAQAEVAVVDTREFKVIGRWKVEEHPNELLLSKDGKRLFAANANRNSVTIVDTGSGKTLETLVATLTPDALPGNTPNSLALSPDERRLFVANANINTVAVFDVATPGAARSLGFIPVGWYPTSVRVTPDGKRLLVANGKGIASKSNRNGPVPGRKPIGGVLEYIGGLFEGTLSVLDLPVGEGLDKKLAEWTALAYQCLPATGEKPDDSALAGSPVPREPGGASPIKYCLYIVKENRTYDQVLGDMKEGNGAAELCLFGEKITPNHHALAREFVLFDNFYVESEVSADGHEWTMGAYATDFVEKMWPLSYGHNAKHGKFPYPSEGAFPIAAPAGGYLWDRAKAAGVTYRSYGEFVQNGKKPGDPATARLPALRGHFDPQFRGFDTAYPDVKRAERFIAELHRFEQEGEMPRLQILRLPNDHTSGTSPGKPTPTAQVADNDLAFGQVVEAVSKSKFWPQTAIFVVEDDAQNGPDHVDAHRTIAFAISPYIRRGSVDSHLYSTSSMLRTIELILGLKPMSQFDAAALPMTASFQNEPDLRAYETRPVDVDRNEVNMKTAWGAGESRRMNFSKEDAADDLRLNEIVWRSVRGAHSPMPAPVRAGFVFTKPGKKDDD